MSQPPPATHDAAADADEDGQRLIADSAERLFSQQVTAAHRQAAEQGRWDADLWQQVSRAGFALLLATEDAGGFAQPWTSAFAVMHGIGRHQVPLPLAETMVAAQLLSMAGLPVPDGPLTLIEQGPSAGAGADTDADTGGDADTSAGISANIDRRDGASLQVHGSGAALRLTGQVHSVPWARHAVAAVVSLVDGRLALLGLPAGGPVTGVRVQPHHNHAGLPSDTVHLAQAPVAALADHPLALPQPVWTLGAIARSAMLAGALESTLAQSLQYANDRVQFGKPIGRYQAIQQNLALMAGDVAAARMAAQVAAADAPGAGPSGRREPGITRFSAAVAKLRCSEAATRAAGIAHQVHGAIGFTREHPLHQATRRLWAWRSEFGSDAHWAAELGRAAIQAGADGFWPAITQRRF